MENQPDILFSYAITPPEQFPLKIKRRDRFCNVFYIRNSYFFFSELKFSGVGAETLLTAGSGTLSFYLSAIADEFLRN